MTEILTLEQLNTIDIFLKQSTSNSSLVIIIEDNSKRKMVLDYICAKKDWTVVNALDLISDIVNHMSVNKLPELKVEISKLPALIIDDFDCFKCDELLQYHFVNIVNAYKGTIILSLKNKTVFSSGIKQIIDNSIKITLLRNRNEK